jgi:hypothetical protein
MNYDYYKNDIALLMEVAADDPNYVAQLPSLIAAGENRIYRELDLLSTIVTDSSIAFTANIRKLTLPTAIHFVTTQQFNVITPVGAANPDAGLRNPLTMVTKEYLDAVWGSSTGAGVPKWAAMLDDQNIIVGPWPDAAYKVETIGTVQPAPLSATNPTTFLTLYLYDLFQAASMIAAMEYQRDATGVQSWQGAYSQLSASAGILEARKKYQSSAWASMSPAPIATPSRGAA